MVGEPDHKNYSWDWLAGKFDAELIPLAKRFVAKKATQGYYTKTWNDGTPVSPEQGHLHDLCKEFDSYYISEEFATKTTANFHLISMLTAPLGSGFDDLRAVAMVEGGDWAGLPDVYQDDEYLKFLEEQGFIQQKEGKYRLVCKALLDHCLRLGRCMWGRGPYNPEQDPFLSGRQK